MRAIEANTAEFLVAMGRAGDGEERDDERVRWVIGGSPIDYHNCVVRAGLTPETADEAIGASVARLRAHRVPGTWHVGPSMRPADLGERLVRHGFANAGDEIGMAVDLGALPDRVAAPAGLTVRRVGDGETLAAWTRTLAAGFGEGEREAAWVGATFARIGLGDDVPWRHYLGLLDGAPVATSSLFLGAGVAGLYFVFTVATARRRGIGAALSLAPLREARAMGLRLGVLGASAMGFPVYRRLGFREHCRIHIYEWRPPA
ncbi:MAG TPA: N-acetyltransferase [Candidatus Dormibacteraeota bacterium]